MSDIFISYANEDRPRAQRLAEALASQDWSIFWDRTIPTGKTWREVIGAELEYAARAGTKTLFSFGDGISEKDANFGGNLGKTSEVGSYPANPWKLHDMHGNVWEWVEDCWNRGYEGAPRDGSAWTKGECKFRVLRGGSWVSAPRNLRLANRLKLTTGYRDSSHGFRVARTLP